MIKPIESVLDIERGLYDSKFCILSPLFDRSRVNMLHPTNKMLPCRHHVQLLRHLGENLYHSEYCIFNPIEHCKGMTGETGSGHGFCISVECEAVGPGATGQRSGVLIGGRGVVGDTNRPQLAVGKPARTSKIFTGCICLPINHWLLTKVRIFFTRVFSPELIFHSL
jgi:hypothetical protein